MHYATVGDENNCELYFSQTKKKMEKLEEESHLQLT
jgi:hypothetical protein